jgi:hypothetical protein
MVDQLRLTGQTRSTEDLLADLIKRASLPADTWKRLCLAFIRRMGQAQPVLAQFCALEASDLAFAEAWPPEAQETMRTEKLEAIERRRIGRGRVKTASLPDPLYLYLRYRRVHDLVHEASDEKALTAALQDHWTRWGAPGKVPRFFSTP